MAPSKNEYTKGLSYVAQTPSFLKNFGKAPASPPQAGPSGRAALPERPSDGEWARGSDGEDDEDEWGARFGGGGDEGPQVVVLKEGRHLSAEEVKRERRRAAGKASRSPPPATEPNKPPALASMTRTVNNKPTKTTIGKASTAKRKLVGAASGEGDEGDRSAKGAGVKKKKRGKGMLSFDEAEGE